MSVKNFVDDTSGVNFDSQQVSLQGVYTDKGLVSFGQSDNFWHL